MVTASRIRISGAAISIAFGLAISAPSCIDLTVDPGSSGDPEWTSSSSAASSTNSSSSTGSSSSSSGGGSGGGSGSSSSSGNPAAVCGDALVSMPEECDDGNMKPGDGCSPFCTLEHPEVCPGTTIALTSGGSITIAGTNEGASDKFSAATLGLPNSNCSNGNFFGPDLVYRVIPDEDGTLKAEFTADYSTSWVHISSSCPGGADDELACRYTNNSGNKLTLNLPVLKGVPYYVIADATNNDAGSFTLTLTLQ